VTHHAPQAPLTDAAPHRNLALAFGFALLAALAILGLALVAPAVRNAHNSLAFVGSLALTAALASVVAFSFERSFAGLAGHPRAASYRLAFAAAAVVGLTILAASHDSRPSTAASLGVVVGAFAGGLAATWRDGGLWEDNSPPPPETVRFVLAAHRRRLGDNSPVPHAKRWLDVAAAGAGLLLLSPLAFVVCFLLWLEDPGPLFFVKNSVGRGGRNFRQWKLRTMVRGAESESGPIWAERDDRRVLRLGVLLRRTALDELPQLVNILAGQMSLVGPRPQRTVLVAEYLRRMPEFADRHALPPGLAGLAQVAGHYYLTPRQKLRFDRLYLRHAGVGFDLKLMAIAFAVVLWLRWRPNWNGRLPRAWLHGRRRSADAGARRG